MCDSKIVLSETQAWASFMKLHLLQQRQHRQRVWMRTMLMERDENASRLLGSILEEKENGTVIYFMRISREDFQYIYTLIAPSIRRQDTNMRLSITAKNKLIVTLRYIASGDDFKSLEYAYRISNQCISKFIPDVCHQLMQILREYVKRVLENEGIRHQNTCPYTPESDTAERMNRTLVEKARRMLNDACMKKKCCAEAQLSFW